MFASLTNAVFAVPENPVRRGEGMGRLGYAMGQPVILGDSVAPGDAVGGVGSQYNVGPNGQAQYTPFNWGAPPTDGSVSFYGSDPQYSVDPNGQLQYNQMGAGAPGDQYTASYCNAIINGGNASSMDLFQCSLRGYVGANGIYPPGTYVPPASIPPALVPDPPTSVTIPNAVMTVSTMPPQARSAPGSRCANGGGVGIDSGGAGACWLAIGAGVLAYFLFGGGGRG